MARFASRDEVRAEVEGSSMHEALEYGIRHDDMPEGDTELRTAWLNMRDGWDMYQESAARVMALLPD